MLSPEGLQELGIHLPPGSVLKLRKALYGLKQSPRIWWQLISTFLTNISFHCHSEIDVNIFTLHRDDQTIILLLFVDDMLLAGDDALINWTVDQTSSHFRVNDLGPPTLFLGLQLDLRPDGIFVHQTNYARKLLNRFQITNSHPKRTPLPSHAVLHNETDPTKLLPLDKATRYRAIVGGLGYLNEGTRPDYAYPISRLSKFNAKPSSSHSDFATHSLQYLAGTFSLGLFYPYGASRASLGPPLMGFSDSDFAADIDNRRSTSAFVFILNSSAVSWKAKQQSLVTRSTHDAEYVGLANAAYEANWLRKVLHALDPHDHQEMRRIGLLGDNQSAITTAHAPLDSTSSSRSKHIDVRFHIIREAIHNNAVSLTYIRTSDMVADALTKSLPTRAPAFEKHRSALGLRCT